MANVQPSNLDKWLEKNLQHSNALFPTFQPRQPYFSKGKDTRIISLKGFGSEGWRGWKNKTREPHQVNDFCYSDNLPTLQEVGRKDSTRLEGATA